MIFMDKNKEKRIKSIVAKIPALTNGQLIWLDRVIKVFERDYQFKSYNSDIINQETLFNFGDALRIHHTFSIEPFSKDKFEYVLEQSLNSSYPVAALAPKGNPGHDITINGVKISLKTQADKNLKIDTIRISKFMELGKGKWGDKPEDLEKLRKSFLNHLKKYKRILMLRTLEKSPRWRYELVEIPISLLRTAKDGELEMKLNSKQFPKPGYCHVPQKAGDKKFQLYFDGGGERKLQIKNLSKELCAVHATWEFTIPT